MKKNGFAPLIIILVIAILGVVVLFVYKNSLPKSLNNISNILTNENLPKIAFINDFGVANPSYVSSHPAVGTINIFDPNTDKTEVLYKIDTNLISNSAHFLGYSPSTSEVLVQVNKGILGININTKAQRNVFTGDEDWMQMLSGNPDSVCFFDNGKQKYMQVDLKSLEELPVNSVVDGCIKDPSVYDYKNGTLATIQSKYNYEGAGPPSSNSLIVNRAGSSSKTFPLPGDAYIQIILNTNGYLLIKNSEMVDENNLKSLKQMDLSDGRISDPTSISPLWEKIQSGPVYYVGYSPDGKYFIYSTSSKTYAYNIQNDKEAELGDFRPFAPLNQLHFPWSTDGQYFLLRLDNKNNYVLYDMKKLSMEKLTFGDVDNLNYFAILQ